MNGSDSVGEWLDWARRELQTSGYSDTPSIEAQWIFEKVTGAHRPELLSHPEKPLSDTEITKIRDMLEKVKEGVPLPYVLGEWSFFGNTFQITPDVLIPRPETEILVEQAIEWAKDRLMPIRFADVGTGCGCIAVSLLNYFKSARFTGAAIDISDAALRVARRNIDHYRLNEVLFPIRGNLTECLSSPLDLVCANLPYIPSERCRSLDVAQNEPLLALDGGEDGFDLYRMLLRDLTGKMAKESLILCEIDFSQKREALSLSHQLFPDASVTIKEDYAGLSRLLMIRKS